MKEKRKNIVEGAILWQQALPHPISTNYATVINQFHVSVKDWHATATLLTKVLAQVIIMLLFRVLHKCCRLQKMSIVDRAGSSVRDGIT